MNFKTVHIFFLLLSTCQIGISQVVNDKEAFIETLSDGNCYYRENSKDVYKDTTLVIEIRPAYEKVVVIPAKFETISETVVIEEETYIWVEGQRVKVPAKYREVLKKVLVEGEKTEVQIVPAETTTVTKKVLVEKGKLIWKKIPCSFQEEGNTTFEENRKIALAIGEAKSAKKSLQENEPQKLKEVDALIEYLELLEINNATILENMVVDYVETYGDAIVPNLSEEDSRLDFLPSEVDNVQVYFEPTKDGTDSNQKIKKVVIDGFTEALKIAVKAFKDNGYGELNSITISATSNGVHSKQSNHKRKLALDINKINDRRIMQYGSSKSLDQNWELLKNNTASFVVNGDRNFWKKVDLLQKCFNGSKRIRESFSPSYLLKYLKTKGEWTRPWSESKERELIKQHRNHLHFSFL